jgi:putative transposase
MPGESDIGRKHLAHPPIVNATTNRSLFTSRFAARIAKAFSHPAIVLPFVDVWQQASLWLVGRYVIMPDHIHLFCAPNMLPMTPLKQWVKYWKSLASLT